MQPGPEPAALKAWIETSLRDNSHTLAAGYQGKTLEYRDADYHLVIKVPHGRGLVKYLHTLMLRHEHRVYQQLGEFDPSPKCYGMVDNNYLVLEFVNAKSIRERRPKNPQLFFEQLIRQIRQMHGRHVAHMDLKKKDNLLVTDNDMPCIIDFGAAVIYKPGLLHILNHAWYRLAVRFDYNAWIKHKYHDNTHNISTEDQQFYQRTWIEHAASNIKSAYRSLTKFFK